MTREKSSRRMVNDSSMGDLPHFELDAGDDLLEEASRPARARAEAAAAVDGFLGHARRPILPRSSMIFFWSARKASISASGRGGQPGT